MSFATRGFIAFFAVLFLLYYTIPKKHQWKLLLVGSGFFYWFAGWYCLAYIAATAVTTWWTGRKIETLVQEQEAVLAAHASDWEKEERKAYKAKAKKKRTRWVTGCMVFNFGILALLKYTGFFLGIFGISFRGFAAVMGISFYTFQSMGYLLDVHWGKTEAQKSLPKFALFVGYFPQLIQGPISRYGALSETLYGEHSWNSREIALGAERVIWGFAKKMIIADRLAIPLRTLVAKPETYTGVYVAAVIVLYAAELYADFTGGIDITIGISRMLGIRVTENFIRPFFSKNTEEYWQRWHITMGTWFKDYVFYPLSTAKWMLHLHKKCKGHLGSFGKKVTVYLTTLLLWFVTGIWHGASWNFIVWGLLNGIVILISQELKPVYARFHRANPQLKGSRWYDLFQIARTFCLMSLIRVLDVYRNVPLTFRQVGTLVTGLKLSDLWNGSFLQLGIGAADWIVAGLGIAAMAAVSLLGRRKAVSERLLKKPIAASAACLLGIVAIFVFGVYGIGFDSTQFIYNQF